MGWGPWSDTPPVGLPSAVMTTQDAPYPTATTSSSITIEWLPVRSAMGMKMDKYELQIAAIDVPPDPLGEMMDVHGLGYCTKEEASAEMPASPI